MSAAILTFPTREAEIHERARSQLIAECTRPGITQAAFIDYQAEFGAASAAEFVSACEGANTCLWSDRIHILSRDDRPRAA